jgi:predicted RNase H-like HicB family nuclease
MKTVKIIYWEEKGLWLGYLTEYPDYWTQGETLEDLKDHLRDLFQDITSVQIPELR